MAETYGMCGKEILSNRLKGNTDLRYNHSELNHNVIGDYEYYRLVFYTGGFNAIKNISKIRKGLWDGAAHL